MRVLLALDPFRRDARRGSAVSLHGDSIRLWHSAGAGVRHRPRRSRHQCGHPWRCCLVQIRRRTDGVVEFAGLAMGAPVALGAEAAPRHGLQSGRAQSLPDFREVSGMLCAGCGVQGTGDRVGNVFLIE
jgi:hypothetical protein